MKYYYICTHNHFELQEFGEGQVILKDSNPIHFQNDTYSAIDFSEVNEILKALGENVEFEEIFEPTEEEIAAVIEFMEKPPKR